MTNTSLGPAVVLGAGIGGLAAAAAFVRADVPVTIVEKDALPDGPRPRSGVPQSEQLHNLLTRAQVSLDALVPGFCAALVAAGAGSARVADETHVFELGVRMPERDLGMRLMCAPRPLIEYTLRQLVLARGGVEIVEDTRASGLVLDGHGDLCGVATDRGTIAARVVVDATGTPSPAAQWLRAIGRAAPATQTTPVAHWYVSTRFHRPQRWHGSADFWLIFPTPPNTLGGLVSPSGPDEWYVSVSGRGEGPRPASVADVRAHAAALEDPWIGELLAGATPLSEPRLFHKATARRRDYADPLPGFVALGDALASLNPLFGQGISVAAQQAAILADLVTQAATPAALTAAYLPRAAAAAERAITLGAAVDAVLPNPAAFAARLVADPELHRLYVRVWHLLEPASALAPYSFS